ncbi:MAG: SRPBCC domain-containing protein [Hyphomicrobiaceae bacterium]|nr:SRPBCC domain-containing protein [Hyphomicrobiaceae bacterium]
MSNAAAEDTEVLQLTIEREFAHPPEAVFAAWTDEKALRRWMGPGEVKAPESRMEAREGGTYVFPMITPDGKTPTVRGKILEIVPNKKLRFTWSWDQEDGSAGQLMEVSLDFRATASGTLLVLHHTNFIDVEARDHHNSGWIGCLVNLEDYLAG